MNHTPLGSTAISDFLVAVAEATSNAVIAQSKVAPRQPVIIQYSISAQALQVDVIDKAGGFAPEEQPALPEVTDPKRLTFETGLGIYLYTTNSDQHAITPTKKGTTVSLRKFFPSR